MKKTFLVAIAVLSLCACVEIKDPEQQTSDEGIGEKPVMIEKAEQLIVDQPLYLFEGRVLTQSQWEAEGRLPNRDQKIVYQYDFLEISEGAVLYTLGQDVRLNIKKMTSSGAVATFPPGITSPRGQAGIHGGVVDMRIENAEGRMQVVLRGTSGGQGFDGKEPDDALRGRKGKDHPKAICGDERMAEVGGGPGAPGYRGDDGLPGGNSGKLHLFIKRSEDFIYDIKKEVGGGGAPGNGNPRGGRPGPSGLNNCYASLPFEDPNLFGGPGEDGTKGKDGMEEAAYITDNDRKLIL